ncbi:MULTISPECIES: antibiotic biosynthesis monooxygenase family protein [Sphingomonas]|uniref:antibiotic biosynthesis monooxygenase family protein n=1 Tax=Sphingomonas TaxID=13687 RepID=UPI000831EDA2|nr:antibiotic biosynthesis monooxygenase [Sphingomonas sp. CCH10-B3]
MTRVGQIAVIFMSVRTDADAEGYTAAAEAMEARAALQPGYCGFHSARGADGFGITVSYWADDDCAKAWRDDPEHRRIREAGRARWYRHYELVVARVERDYDWQRA